MTNKSKISAPVFAVARHRMATDGQGVTTLVTFHGCPLRCEYCINPQCFDDQTPMRNLSPKELIDEVMIDHLYFVATGGGVTFGGGEPLLRSEFIRDFCNQCPSEWRISVETSLHVPLENLQMVAPFVDCFFIDVKDMNADIYKRYTGKDNQHAIDNLNWIAEQEGMTEKVIIRLPEISNYNTQDDIKNSRQQLAAMDFNHFDCFKYLIRTRR